MSMSVDDVIAHAVYDPVARRERYLRERQLKGRPKPRAPIKIGPGARIIDANTPIGSARHYSAASAAARQAASDARQVAAITKRLDGLKAHLRELLAKKKAESAKKSTSSSTTKKTDTTKTSTTQDKPKTAAQKQAAKESLAKARKAREAKKAASPTTTTAPSLTLDEQISKTRAVINTVEAQLRAVKEKSSTQTASNGR